LEKDVVDLPRVRAMVQEVQDERQDRDAGTAEASCQRSVFVSVIEHGQVRQVDDSLHIRTRCDGRIAQGHDPAGRSELIKAVTSARRKGKVQT
jgi:hypothetical protein